MEKVLSSAPRPLSPGDAMRRVLEYVATGALLAGQRWGQEWGAGGWAWAAEPMAIHIQEERVVHPHTLGAWFIAHSTGAGVHRHPLGTQQGPQARDTAGSPGQGCPSTHPVPVPSTHWLHLRSGWCCWCPRAWEPRLALQGGHRTRLRLWPHTVRLGSGPAQPSPGDPKPESHPHIPSTAQSRPGATHLSPQRSGA